MSGGSLPRPLTKIAKHGGDAQHSAIVDAESIATAAAAAATAAAVQRADTEAARKLEEADRQRQEVLEKLNELRDKEAKAAKANEAAQSELQRQLTVQAEARRVAEIEAAKAGAQAEAAPRISYLARDSAGACPTHSRTSRSATESCLLGWRSSGEAFGRTTPRHSSGSSHSGC